MMQKKATLNAQPRSDNRLNLLDAAARRFCSRSYYGKSMRDIASDVGIKAGSIYYYFESKKELLIAVQKEGIRRITSLVSTAIVTANTPWDRLQAAMISNLQEILSGNDYAQVVIRELPRIDDPRRRRLIDARNKYDLIFIKPIKDLEIGSEIKCYQIRFLIMGAMNWSPMWFKSDGQSPEVPKVS
jgi:TetR/AcrR family transcriptional regulator, cholesterol catabolism regulator